jgi:periplasmic protein TonB
MFEYIKQSERPNGLRYVASLLLSVTTHAAILGLIVTVPMIFCSSLRPDVLTWLNIEPIHLMAPVPPSPSFHTSSSSTTTTGKGHGISNIGFTAPIQTPIGVNIEPPGDDPLVSGPFGDMDGIGLGSDIYGGPNAAVGTFIPQLKNDEIIPPPIPKKLQPPKQILVVSAIQASKLIHKVTPVYPELARRARASGTVTLMAFIDEDGNVADLKVLSGPPLLVDAAREAVQQWKYSPTILNGEPVTVQAVVNVIFTLQ